MKNVFKPILLIILIVLIWVPFSNTVVGIFWGFEFLLAIYILMRKKLDTNHKNAPRLLLYFTLLSLALNLQILRLGLISIFQYVNKDSFLLFSKIRFPYKFIFLLVIAFLLLIIDLLLIPKKSQDGAIIFFCGNVKLTSFLVLLNLGIGCFIGIYINHLRFKETITEIIPTLCLNIILFTLPQIIIGITLKTSKTITNETNIKSNQEE